MHEDVSELVRRNIELTKENNRLLHSIRRAAWWGTFFKVLWMAIIIGVPVLLYYYFLQPYYRGLSAGYQQFQEQSGGIQIPGFGPLLDRWLGEETQVSPE